MPKISVVTCHVPLSDKLNKMLDISRDSLNSQYDEYILVINSGIGYGTAHNWGFKQARGDFMIAVSNDTKLIAGNLKDMCIENTVTYSDNAQWGCFFCLPREIYLKVGGFDESFGMAYWEDEDYLRRLEKWGIPLKRIESIKVEHEGGVTVKALNIEQESYIAGQQRFIEKYGITK